MCCFYLRSNEIIPLYFNAISIYSNEEYLKVDNQYLRLFSDTLRRFIPDFTYIDLSYGTSKCFIEKTNDLFNIYGDVSNYIVYCKINNFKEHFPSNIDRMLSSYSEEDRSLLYFASQLFAKDHNRRNLETGGIYHELESI